MEETRVTDAKPNAQDIEAEIQRLQSLRLTLQSKDENRLGDDDKAALNSVISVLELRLSEDGVRNRFRHNRHLLDWGLRAARWLIDFAEDNRPSVFVPALKSEPIRRLRRPAGRRSGHGVGPNDCF